MKRRGPARYSNAEIDTALARVKGGETLSAVAKDLGTSKSTLKYWADRASSQPSRTPVTSQQAAKRMRKLADRAWLSITLAFRKLNAELAKEKPQGVRDLVLAIAVLADKMRTATDSLQSQAQSSASGWEASDETLLILKRHRERQTSAPPVQTQAEVHLGGRDAELQKDAAAQIPEIVAPPTKTDERRNVGPGEIN